jgi:predicted RNase H-like HicB family nuclease
VVTVAYAGHEYPDAEKRGSVVKQTFAVHYRLDSDGSWFVNTGDVQGAHTSGRHITTARANIREAIALALDVDEQSFDLLETFDFPDVDALT